MSWDIEGVRGGCNFRHTKSVRGKRRHQWWSRTHLSAKRHLLPHHACTARRFWWEVSMWPWMTCSKWWQSIGGLRRPWRERRRKRVGSNITQGVMPQSPSSFTSNWSRKAHHMFDRQRVGDPPEMERHCVVEKGEHSKQMSAVPAICWGRRRGGKHLSPIDRDLPGGAGCTQKCAHRIEQHCIQAVWGATEEWLWASACKEFCQGEGFKRRMLEINKARAGNRESFTMRSYRRSTTSWIHPLMSFPRKASIFWG